MDFSAVSTSLHGDESCLNFVVYINLKPQSVEAFL